MPEVLRISFRFLDTVYHGRSDGGEPEWPPSPLRVFQAVVAAAASRWPVETFKVCAVPAVGWLQTRYPEIVAPEAQPADRTYRLYVPNNAADLVAADWNRGNTWASFAEHRTEKDVRPTHLSGEAVYYLFRLPPEGCPHFDVLKAAARSITHLGWGVDMVAADADIISESEAQQLSGERWSAVATGGVPLRVPISGTLADLMRKHQDFLGRLSGDGFKPVPPLAVFDIQHYRRETDHAAPAWVVFSLLTPDGERSRPFNPLRGTRDLAGMVRHALCLAADKNRPFAWTDAHINQWVHGKNETGDGRWSGKSAPDRFSYLPLPTINKALERVESIRRVMVTAPPGAVEQIQWVRRVLSGAELFAEVHDQSENQRGSSLPCPPDSDRLTNAVEGESRPVALLTLEQRQNWVVQQYTGTARVWSTVTPVILPGYDDPKHYRRRLQADGVTATDQQRLLARLDARIDGLLRRAMRQAGWSDTIMNETCIEYRPVGFRAGVDLAKAYLPPQNLQPYSRYHVRLTFPQAVTGPIAIGSGRFRGFGLFAREAS